MKTVKHILPLIKKFFFLTVPCLFIFPGPLLSQYPVNYQYTLLPSKIMDELIGAASGDRAMLHINEMAAYSRPRTDSEYQDFPEEINYVAGKIREYGISNFTIEKFGKTTTWRGIDGSLWEVSPGISKIADYKDLPEMIAEGSQSADVKAPLIWAGEGLPSFFETNPAKINGKIILTSGPPWSVHSLALKAGALGLISYYSPRPLIDPVQIPNMGISGGGFAFMLPPREGQLLRDRLIRNEAITVHAKVKSKNEEIEIQVPQCVIEGSDSTAGEILFTAHLFEGYVKMGANDNISGSAVLLEIAHILHDLIGAGKIPKPVRNIRFLWVTEFSGTIPWVNNHRDILRNALCDINLDMVGLRLRDNKSFMYLHRSGYSTAHFVNDVMESYYRYVGETNSEGITDDLGRRGFVRRIVSPTGTDDPFYYKISSMHGSSDNAVFNDWGIGVPAVKMITWPDNYYHTSEDTPDKCDPTQLRRAIIIAAAGAYTMASADDATAVSIISEMYAGTCTRLGIQIAKSSDMILKATAETIKSTSKRAIYNIEGFVMAEKSAMDKIRQISEKPDVINALNNRKEKLDNLLQIQLSALHDLVVTRSKELSVTYVEVKPDDLEAIALKIIPVKTEEALTMGFGGDYQYISALSADFRNRNPYNNIVSTNEVAGLADGKRNLLQIKKMVDSEFERESPLKDIINYFSVLKEAGLMKF
jgi:aminopeptidase YwaD